MPSGVLQASKALEQLDGNKLKGRLRVKDKQLGSFCSKAVVRMKISARSPRNVMASEYFGHFCMLMHLEHMEELRQIRQSNQMHQEPSAPIGVM